MVDTCFDKKPSGGATIQNQQLNEELHKPIIRKLQKRKAYSSFKDNIWGAHLSDILLLSKFNKDFGFLFCVVYIYNLYKWVVPLKDKGYYNYYAFQKILNESNHKANKIRVDKASKFYNRSMKTWFQNMI